MSMVSLILGKNFHLFHYLHNKILTKKLPKKDINLPCHGLQILVRNPRKSLIGRSIYLSGLWEPETTHFISMKMKAGMNVLDVGADIGYYTLLFAKLVGAKGNVYAFEPIPKAKQYLDKNVELNELKNVSTFGFALFDDAGMVCLEDPFNKSKINPQKKRLSRNDIQVEMKVFDGLRSEESIGRVDFIKLDVEGAEMNILRGMRETIKKDRPEIIIELHPSQLKDFGFSPSEFINFFSELGYQIDPVDRLHVDFSQGNITLFCRKK